MRLPLLAISTIAASLFGCGQSLVDASTEIDLAKLRPFLKAVQPLIENGFGDAQISQIEQEFRKLALDGTKTITFPIVYRGAKADLRVTVRKEDSDTVEIHLFAPPQLAEQIKQAFKSLLY